MLFRIPFVDYLHERVWLFSLTFIVGSHIVLHFLDLIEHWNATMWIDFSAPISWHPPTREAETCEDMKCLRRLMDSGWVREWLLPELSLGSSAMLNCRFRRSRYISTPEIWWICNICIYIYLDILTSGKPMVFISPALQSRLFAGGFPELPGWEVACPCRNVS